MQLPLAYPNLLLIGSEWLLLHSFVLLSQRKWRVSVASLTLQLLADIAIVASILAFSGGVHNPFFALLLLPLLLTVGILPLASQYSLLAFILVASTLLILVPAPASSSIPNLPNSVYGLLFTIDGGIVRDTPFNPIDVLAKLGLWLNLLLMASITAFFLSRLHQRLDEQQQALQAAQTSSREAQHLLTLGLAAASTAHELSTPLATISLLASEAQDAYDHHETTEAKIALTQIQTLIQVCKQQISDSLKQHNLNRSHQLRILLWSDYLSQLLAHWQALRPSASVRLILS
jgi:two-component system sensor histidine kinase RegB